MFHNILKPFVAREMNLKYMWYVIIIFIIKAANGQSLWGFYRKIGKEALELVFKTHDIWVYSQYQFYFLNVVIMNHAISCGDLTNFNFIFI